MIILEDFTVGPLAVRAYVFGCPEKKEAMVIDPAGSEQLIADRIGSLGLRLKYIVNTHGHPDHTCGNKRMKEITGAPVLMHEADDKLFRDPEVARMFLAWGFEPAPPADEYIKDGDIIRIGNLGFEVIHTPGHSPGSVCLYGHNYIATGDTLFIDAIGRTDLPGGSYDTLMKSLKERIYPLPDSTIVLPGHDYGPKPTATLGEQKKTNPYLSF